MCQKLIELLSWNGPTIHVWCFILARAHPLKHSLAEVSLLFVETIRIIIKYLKYLKLIQHVSDHKGSIIRELYTVLG
jgi:hypothetical protein